MPLPKSFTTVTPLSKALAMILFITLPFIGFYFGINYPKELSPQTQIVNTTQPSPTPDPTAYWKYYIDDTLGILFKYPNEWEVKVAKGQNGNVLQVYTPTAISIENYIPAKEKEKFIISIKKWEKKAKDNYALYSQIVQLRGSGDPYSYSDWEIKHIHGNEIVYRGGVGAANREVEVDQFFKEREAYILKGNGDVIHIKPGILVGESKDFYDKFLSTFKFREQKAIKAGFQSYEHPQLHYMVQYPSSWKLDTSQYAFNVLSPDYLLAEEGQQSIIDGAGISINEVKTTETSIEKMSELFLPGIIAESKKVITVAGTKAIQFDQAWEGGPVTYTFFIKNGVKYIIALSYPDQKAKDENFPVYQKILSTFKFID